MNILLIQSIKFIDRIILAESASCALCCNWSILCVYNTSNLFESYTLTDEHYPKACTFLLLASRMSWSNLSLLSQTPNWKMTIQKLVRERPSIILVGVVCQTTSLLAKILAVQVSGIILSSTFIP